MYKPKNVDDYIEFHTEWKKELNVIRSILHQSDLEETIKWFIPTYTWNNKNVIGIGAFKNWVAIWFFQGSFLSDPYNVLINAQEGKTQGQRQWRFEKSSEINSEKILMYIQEASDNQKKGLEINPIRKNKTLLKVPPLLEIAMKKHSSILAALELLSISKRNEYIQYIHEAKQEATKIRRVEKCLPIIQSIKGLNDRYT